MADEHSLIVPWSWDWDLRGLLGLLAPVPTGSHENARQMPMGTRLAMSGDYRPVNASSITLGESSSLLDVMASNLTHQLS